MIKIVKSPVPAGLLKTGPLLTNELNAAFDKSPASYRNGKKALAIDTNAYKTEEIKKALIAAQHNKCCFSEAKFSGDFHHVEHFRPKGRIDDWPSNKKNYPGYYWLSYEWSNLFLCKELINVSFKKNYFPLVNEANRNKDHHQAYVEKPMLIDPCADDPRKHIVFRNDEPIHKTKRGALTIKLLGLRHAHFEEARRKYFAILLGFKEVVDIGIAQGMQINNPIFIMPLDFLRKSILPDAIFSSMAIDLLQGWTHL